ncbi:hypothetical protein EKN06_01070 [Croceicoccus ponticola]|uniref:ParB/Sulfiredoxin domain-containing protein n=1 Tax=Croceicoccus ponticola TaxID=2217664 RepID=A0A437GZQ0_9SPHN|nr:hypothetical protein [Croceicoccus ponticola]RVQ68851.1 hypothetical protein EKN06_01070 [Croceicoccus ponticola]
MPFESIRISDLMVNPANDRHGELRDESAAIGELFHEHEPRMRALAEDIAREGRIFDPPLVMLHDDSYVVFDGNRRVTCIKLIRSPDLAPNDDLRQFFQGLRNKWEGRFPSRIMCQVEADREAVDNILFRRHTGTQAGVGQIGWDDRAKRNFSERTGRGNTANVSASIEAFLDDGGMLPEGRIPWSTLARLLSSEQFRNRVGVSTAGRQFVLTHDRDVVLNTLHRITSDLASGDLTLGDLWNNEGKRRYLDQLETENILPTEQHRNAVGPQPQPPIPGRRGRPARHQPASRTLIPAGVPSPQWTADQQRLSRIWDELCSLPIRTFPNATAALLRMLLEHAVEGYIAEHGISERQDLSRRVGVVARSLLDRDLIDQRYFEEIERIRQNDELISVASMQRLLHSPDFSPMEREFRAYWDRLGRFIVAACSL